MEKEQYFKEFQDLCVNILAQSGNCQDSQKAFKEANTIPQLVVAWKRFWNGILTEVPVQVVTAFAKLYSVYKDDINKAGVYYNEEPQSVPTQAMIIIGDSEQNIEIHGNHHIYVLGNAAVSVYDNSSVYVGSANANVSLYGYVRANVKAGMVAAHEHSYINGSGVLSCYDASVVNIMGGTLDDYGHSKITAYNDAVVNSFTSKKIQLFGFATLNKR